MGSGGGGEGGSPLKERGREMGYGDKKQIENTMIGLGERADDADEAGGRAVGAAGRMDGRMVRDG